MNAENSKSSSWRIELRSRDALGGTFSNSGKNQHLFLTLINNHGAAVAEIHGAQRDGDFNIKFALPPISRSPKVGYYIFGDNTPYGREDSRYIESSKMHVKSVGNIASGSETEIRKAWGLAKEEVRKIREKNLDYNIFPENTPETNDANSNSVIRSVVESLKTKMPDLKIKVPALNPQIYPGYNIRANLGDLKPNSKAAQINPSLSHAFRSASLVSF